MPSSARDSAFFVRRLCAIFAPMSDQSSNGRNGNGQFAKGWQGGPGRQPGYRTALARTLENIPDADVKAIRDKIVEQAKSGDMQAAKIILERKWPVPKGAPVEFELAQVEKPEDISKALSQVLTAVARGDLSPEEGSAVANIIEQHRKGMELADIEARLARLEKKAQNGHAQA